MGKFVIGLLEKLSKIDIELLQSENYRLQEENARLSTLLHEASQKLHSAERKVGRLQSRCNEFDPEKQEKELEQLKERIFGEKESELSRRAQEMDSRESLLNEKEIEMQKNCNEQARALQEAERRLQELQQELAGMKLSQKDSPIHDIASGISLSIEGLLENSQTNAETSAKNDENGISELSSDINDMEENPQAETQQHHDVEPSKEVTADHTTIEKKAETVEAVNEKITEDDIAEENIAESTDCKPLDETDSIEAAPEQRAEQPLDESDIPEPPTSEVTDSDSTEVQNPDIAETPEGNEKPSEEEAEKTEAQMSDITFPDNKNRNNELLDVTELTEVIEFDILSDDIAEERKQEEESTVTTDQHPAEPQEQVEEGQETGLSETTSPAMEEEKTDAIGTVHDTGNTVEEKADITSLSDGQSTAEIEVEPGIEINADESAVSDDKHAANTDSTTCTEQKAVKDTEIGEEEKEVEDTTVPDKGLLSIDNFNELKSAYPYVRVTLDTYTQCLFDTTEVNVNIGLFERGLSGRELITDKSIYIEESTILVLEGLSIPFSGKEIQCDFSNEDSSEQTAQMLLTAICTGQPLYATYDDKNGHITERNMYYICFKPQERRFTLPYKNLFNDMFNEERELDTENIAAMTQKQSDPKIFSVSHILTLRPYNAFVSTPQGTRYIKDGIRTAKKNGQKEFATLIRKEILEKIPSMPQKLLGR